MQKSIILSGKKKEQFCKELNINNDIPKILIKINNNKAEYYSLDDDSFCNLDIEIANKYLDDND